MPRLILAPLLVLLSPALALVSDPPQVRTDAYGDPLPEGAIMRIGCGRLRHAGLSSFLFLDDGKTILSAGSDRTLRFWDAASGKQIRRVTLQGPQAQARLALSGNGKWAAAYDQGRITLWDVETGKEFKSRTLAAVPRDHFVYVFFGREGKTVAAVFHGQLTFWDWQEDAEWQLPIPPRRFGLDSSYHARFSPDGRWFAAGGGWEHPLCVYDLSARREVCRFNCNATTSTFSHDSRRLVVACMTNNDGGRETVLRVFELATRREAAYIPMGIQEYYYSLAFSVDGKSLACGASDHGCLFDCSKGAIVHHLPDRPWGLWFSREGRTLLASFSGSQLRLFDVETGKDRHERHAAGFGGTPVTAVSADGRLLAAGDWMDQKVTLWDLSSGLLVRQLPLKGEQRYVRNLAFSPDGRSLIACQYKGFIQSWDVATGAQQFTLQLEDPGHPNKDSVYFYQLHVSPDGKHISTLERILGAQEFTRLARWNTTTGKIEHQHSLPAGARTCAWFRDGSTVALALAEALALVDVKTGRRRFQVAGTSASGPVTVSPDDRLVAVPLAGNKGEQAAIGVWETATGKEVARVATGKVHHLRMLPGNRFLLTTDEQFLRVWDLATRSERLRWPLPEAGTDDWGRSFVFGLEASPDGQQAITILADGTALVWDLMPAWRDRPPEVKR